MGRRSPDLCPVDKGKGAGRSRAANTPAGSARICRRGGRGDIVVCCAGFRAGNRRPLTENQGIGRPRAELVCALAMQHPENGGDA